MRRISSTVAIPSVGLRRFFVRQTDHRDSRSAIAFMTDPQVDYLRACVKAGLMVWWVDNGGASGHLTLKRIISIGSRGDEPGPCGFLGTGIGQQDYVALDNLDTNGVMVTTGDLADWSKHGDE